MRVHYMVMVECWSSLSAFLRCWRNDFNGFLFYSLICVLRKIAPLVLCGAFSFVA